MTKMDPSLTDDEKSLIKFERIFGKVYKSNVGKKVSIEKINRFLNLSETVTIPGKNILLEITKNN